MKIRLSLVLFVLLLFVVVWAVSVVGGYAATTGGARQRNSRDGLATLKRMPG